MEFCSKCGSHMKATRNGFSCPRCGNTVHTKSAIPPIEMRKIAPQDPIYIFDSSQDNHSKVRKECPRCRNKEAFRWLSAASGEHAGISRERTVEHFKCAKCQHTWTEES